MKSKLNILNYLDFKTVEFRIMKELYAFFEITFGNIITVSVITECVFIIKNQNGT